MTWSQNVIFYGIDESKERENIRYFIIIKPIVPYFVWINQKYFLVRLLLRRFDRQVSLWAACHDIMLIIRYFLYNNYV